MSVSQGMHSNVLVLLLSCAPRPHTPLSILVRASLRCSVKGGLYEIFSFLAILAIRKLFVSGHFQPVIEPTNADQLMLF